MKRNYDITITGPGLRPETTPAIEIAELITKINEACSKQIGEAVQEEEEVPFSLVGVGEGSCRLTFALATSYLAAVSTFTGAINSGDYGSVARDAHEALYRVSQLSERLGWGIGLSQDQEMGIQGAQISVERPVPKPAIETVTGTTTLYGTCLRVGGATPRAEIRPIDQGRILFIGVSEDLARRLGGRLYERVELQGRATWDSLTLELTDFTASALGPYRATDPLSAFRQLAAASGDAWEGVHAEAYVSELRSGGIEQ